MVVVLLVVFFYLEWRVFPKIRDTDEEPELQPEEVERISNLYKAKTE
jgi:hypothetical protein